jgi:A/G-specific adenine glycosylase
LKGIANHIKHPILKDKLGWKLAAQIVEAGDGSSPGLVNQALMELGATYCAPAGSGIDDRDPLRDYYLSTQLGRAYLAALKDGGSDDICGDECSSLPSGTKRLTTTSVRGREKCCELCDPDGIHIVLERFRRSISLNSTTMDEAARIGHSAFPTDPPKTEKREEDLAMAVLMTSCSKKGDTANPNDSFRYLMVKRPKEGLLAGQWEFPNVCIQVRKKSKKEKNPTNNTKGPKKAERNRALTKFLLEELFLDHPNDEMPTAVSNQSRRAEKEPLEHVFSHVKHYMWVEFGDLIDVHLEDDDLEWVSPSGKEVRWMNKRDMKKVGITSGVKKVLQSVEKSLSGVSKSMSKRRKN